MKTSNKEGLSEYLLQGRGSEESILERYTDFRKVKQKVQ